MEMFRVQSIVMAGFTIVLSMAIPIAAQNPAAAPAPTSDGVAVDQGIGYVLSQGLRFDEPDLVMFRSEFGENLELGAAELANQGGGELRETEMRGFQHGSVRRGSSSSNGSGKLKPKLKRAFTPLDSRSW